MKFQCSVAQCDCYIAAVSIITTIIAIITSTAANIVIVHTSLATKCAFRLCHWFGIGQQTNKVVH